MRRYNKVYGELWSGPTGKVIKKLGKATQLLAAYLCTSPHANSLGLYFLPVEDVTHEIALTKKETLDTIRDLCRLGFIKYDFETEFVWVIEMAKYQIGEQLSPKDHRVAGIEREYHELSRNPFLPEFFEKYKDQFHLEHKIESDKPLDLFNSDATRSPLEAPYKPLGRGHIREDKISKVKLRGESEGGPDDPFETAWSFYPRDIEKAKARKAFNATVNRGADPEQLILAAKNYQITVTAKKTEEIYIKYGKTFYGPDEPWKDFVIGPRVPRSVRDDRQEKIDKMMNKGLK